MAPPKCVLLNAKRLNFDGALDFGRLEAAADVRSFELSPDDESILANVAGAEVVVTKELVLTGAVIARFPDSVKLLIEAGTGYNNVDRFALYKKNIELRTCPAYSTAAVATLVLTHILNFSTSMYAQQARVAGGDRAHFEDLDRNVGSLPLFEVAGRTLGLIGGNGCIGSHVARLALAHGMRVLVSSRSGAAPDGCEAAPMEKLLRESDFVSIHCPLNDATRHLLDAEKLAMMRPTAYLINTARGAIVDERALVAALRGKRLAGAGLDVQDPEPPLRDSPLWDVAVLTPHVGWRRRETRQRLVDLVAANVAAYAAGEPANVVSPPLPTPP